MCFCLLSAVVVIFIKHITILPPMFTLQLSDVSKRLPNVDHTHITVGVGGNPLNKLDLLQQHLLAAGGRRRSSAPGGKSAQGLSVVRTMIFCNTISSCRCG